VTPAAQEFEDAGVKGELAVHERQDLPAALTYVRERQDDPIPITAVLVDCFDRLGREREFRRVGAEILYAHYVPVANEARRAGRRVPSRGERTAGCIARIRGVAEISPALSAGATSIPRPPTPWPPRTRRP
jgi:hypothetical protein